MKLRATPFVLQGPLTAAQEERIWHEVIGTPETLAPPLTGWPLAVIAFWCNKRELSVQLAKMFDVCEKTLASGLPKRGVKLRKSFESMDQKIKESLERTEPRIIARRKHAIERAARLFASDPTASSFFNQTIGFLGGDDLERFSIAVDDVSTRILQKRVRRTRAPHLTVCAAEQAEIVPLGAIEVRSDIDPGLDALLALTARLDRDWSVKFLADEKRISSILGLLVDMPGGERKRPAAQRLLDIYYALAYAMKHQNLPASLPSVRELEDCLLGSPPASGGQSFIVRWRNGSKKLRIEDVEEMGVHVAGSTGFDLDLDFKILWSVCKLWALIEDGGPDAVAIAGARYQQWWTAMNDPGRVASPLISPYLASFHPHA